MEMRIGFRARKVNIVNQISVGGQVQDIHGLGEESLAAEWERVSKLSVGLSSLT